MCGGGEHFAWQALEQELGTINCQSLRRRLKLSSMVGQIRSCSEYMVKEFEGSFFNRSCNIDTLYKWLQATPQPKLVAFKRILQELCQVTHRWFFYFHL